MASISTVAYTINKRKKIEDGRQIVNATIAFGDGSSTYPSGGVPINIGSLGMRAYLDSLLISDDGHTGYVFKPDLVNGTIRIFETGSINAVQVEISTSVAPALQTLNVQAIGW